MFYFLDFQWVPGIGKHKASSQEVAGSWSSTSNDDVIKKTTKKMGFGWANPLGNVKLMGSTHDTNGIGWYLLFLSPRPCIYKVQFSLCVFFFSGYLRLAVPNSCKQASGGIWISSFAKPFPSSFQVSFHS